MVSIHHFQVTTTDLIKRVTQFTSQFGFRVLGHKRKDQNEEVALFINSVVMVIKTNPITIATLSDWISDVVLHVSSRTDYDKLLIKAESIAETHSYTEGSMGTSLFRVSTPFRSVQHTIMCGECNCINNLTDREQTCFSCLRGFIKCPKLYDENCSLCSDRFEVSCNNVPHDISHVDHVTFACHTHSSEHMLEWYERHLGFKRFKINTSENEEGFVIHGSNGMKMLAMKYWQCSETGLRLGGNDKPVQLVFTEPLPNSGRNQVQMFLADNGGPGVQHIAFHTNNIVGVVSCLHRNNVLFIKPPPEYYSLFEKVSEIKKTDERVELLQDNNILIDFEAEDNSPPKYLMQVFSHPLFDCDTFFLEVIQRCGAAGFGAGNITALWKALEIHFKQQEKSLTTEIQTLQHSTY